MKRYYIISGICLLFIIGLKWIIPEVDKMPITILAVIGIISAILGIYSR